VRARRLDGELFPVHTEVLVDYNSEWWPAVVLRRKGAKADVRYHPHGGFASTYFESGVELARLTCVSLDTRGEADEAEASAKAQSVAAAIPPQEPARSRSHTAETKTEARAKVWVTNMESDARLSGWSFTFRITKGGAVVKKFIDPAGATFRSLISALASLARRVPRSASTPPSPTAAAASVIAAAAPAAARHAGFAPSTSVLVDFNDQKWPATVLRCDARNESVDVRYWPTKGYAESAFESGVAMSRVELARVAEAVGARARVVKRAPPAAASPKLPSRPLERARKKARAAATSTGAHENARGRRRFFGRFQRPLGRPRKRPTMGTVTPRKSPEGAKAARQDTRLARAELPVGRSSARVRNSFVGRWRSLGEREASSALFFDRVRASAEHVRALVERETPPLVEPPPPRDAAAHPAGLAAVAATVASLVVAVVD
jgi:hypothetical protein